MDLNKLNEVLGAESIDFKPTNVKKTKDGNVFCLLLAYKDARVDMDILDKAVGQENWQNLYERDSNGILQCGIGIKVELEWIWKWSCGTPSDYEKEKGEYSDAFKRAGFMWGIGRKLYEFPQIMIWMNEKEAYDDNGKMKISYNFKPNDWKWTISKDYKQIKAEQKIGGKWVVRFTTEREEKPQKEESPKKEVKSSIEIRYDNLLAENKGLFNSQELINLSRSSEWDKEVLTQKGIELKEIISERLDQFAYQEELKNNTDELPFQ